MASILSMAQAQAVFSMRNKPTKKKKKKRRRKRPPSLVEMVEMKKGKVRPKKKRRTMLQQAKATTITTKQKDAKMFTSTAQSLKVISDYHTINKRLAQNEQQSSLSEVERDKIRNELLQEQEKMGGIDAYQKASMFGAKASKFVCADWVEPLLREHLPKATTTPRVLDVGAIDNQYVEKPWIECVPIDLNAQHHSVIQMDFFDYAHNHVIAGTDMPLSSTSSTSTSTVTSTATASTSTTATVTSPSYPFDAVVMSLVLNFQGDPRKRGEMLAFVPSLLKNGGILFVALPSASLDNSRYCNENHFTKICEQLGFQLVEQKRSAKLILFTFSLDQSINFTHTYDQEKKTFAYEQEVPRKVVREEKRGEKRNNFCVMLKNTCSKR